MRKFNYSRIKRLHDQKGMTFVELVMVMVIILILSAISIPLVISYLPTYRLNGAADNLQLAVSLTRMKAVARNRRAALYFPDQFNYRIQLYDGANWVDESGPDKLMSPADLQSQGISIDASAFPAAAGGGYQVVFNMRGSSMDAPPATGGPFNGNRILIINGKGGKKRCIEIAGTNGTAKPVNCP